MGLLGESAEITRFKGLGEISPGEFSGFIGEDIRLTPVIVDRNSPLEKTLAYYMGKNTPDRQRFIIDNLRLEKDPALRIWAPKRLRCKSTIFKYLLACSFLPIR